MNSLDVILESLGNRFYTSNSMIPTMTVTEPMSSLIFSAPETGLLLDTGCGECEYTSILMSESRRIISLDIKGPQIFPKNDIEFMLGSIEHLPFQENSFDFIYCLSVIQLIKDDRAAIEEIYRILKPGARFYITVPTRRSIFRLLRDLEIYFGVYKYPEFNVEHHHCYAKDDIESLIQGLFQVESLKGYNFNFIPRLLDFLSGLFKMRKNVATVFRSVFTAEEHDKSPSCTRINKTEKCSKNMFQGKNKNGERLHPLFWLIYGLAYHYIIVLKKEPIP